MKIIQAHKYLGSGVRVYNAPVYQTQSAWGNGPYSRVRGSSKRRK